MKTTFDLPDSLLRKAKAAAAHQGRPLRDLVADAIAAELANAGAASRELAPRQNAWKAFAARLKKMPDGSVVNPDGVPDEGFFGALDEIRTESHARVPRDPFSARDPTDEVVRRTTRAKTAPSRGD